MKFIQRLGYYLGGFSVGLIILAFIFSGKRTSCAYGPEARVLKNISSKPLQYDGATAELLLEAELDSTGLARILREGDVDFGRSNTKLDSCRTYVIEGFNNQKEITLTIANCEFYAEIIGVDIK